MTVNHISPKDIEFFEDQASQLILNIHIPVGAEGVRAVGRLAWFKQSKNEPMPQYILGIAYEEIERKDCARISSYVARHRFFKGAAMFLIFSLGIGLVAESFHNLQLRYENEKLLNKLSSNLTDQQLLMTKRRTLESQIDEMNFLLSQSNRKIEILEQQLARTSLDNQKVIADLKNSIEFLKKYEDGIRRNLNSLVTQKNKAEAEVQGKGQERLLLEEKILDKLFLWLTVHQNNATGLLTSYEGDSDLRDWAFTYDQALAAITFIKLGDTVHAQKIFEFYMQAPKTDSAGFANAYDAATGEVKEYTTHVGPNVWLGLAILQYTHKTKDTKYLALAQDISRWLETIKDNEGGLKGGREFSWYSTEHNLDAFAFYQMLYQITGDASYEGQAEATLQWLNKNAYSKLSNPVVKRGKGDATMATDTYAWSLTALGPQRLKNIGMDPDGIMDFALEHCGVGVAYQKPDGSTVNIKGFDFAKAQNLARGGVISCEWTAQMILALKIMSDYHQQQGDGRNVSFYAGLADEYISELSKMIITSASPVGQGDFCLPYASSEMADTGHGWRTPKGNKTGSVAATAYTILAIRGLNPLQLANP